MKSVRVNRWLDLLDRAGWTAIQAAGGAGIAALTAPGQTWRIALTSVGTAIAIAVGKVVIAQNTGSDNLGSAVPGTVVEAKQDKKVNS